MMLRCSRKKARSEDDHSISHLLGIRVPPHLKDGDVFSALIDIRVSSTWEDISPSLQNYPPVAFAAIQQGCLKDAPPCLDPTFYADESFFRQAAGNDLLLYEWDNLPEPFRTSEEFARSIPKFAGRVAIGMMATLPNMASDLTFWETLVADEVGELNKLIGKYAPQVVRADRELMLRACHHDTETLEHVNPSFRSDRSFLQSVVQHGNVYYFVQSMPHDIQMLYPDLVLKAVKKFFQKETWGIGECRVHTVVEAIAPILWEDRAFAESCFRAGMPFREYEYFCLVGEHLRVHPKAWKLDKQIFLLIARYGASRSIRATSFSSLDVSLATDKQFILEVLRLDPMLQEYAGGSLLSDFDIALVICAGSRRAAEAYSTRFPNHGLGIVLAQQYVAHSTFLKTVLCGVQLDTKCKLYALNQGAETTHKFMQLLAGFAGIPPNDRISLIRKAISNLADDSSSSGQSTSVSWSSFGSSSWSSWSSEDN